MQNNLKIYFKKKDDVINSSIANALAEAKRAGIKGKEVTPFILAAVSKITSGKSLQTSKSFRQRRQFSAISTPLTLIFLTSQIFA